MHIKKIALIVAILGISTGMWAANDPFVGTWNMILAKSVWEPGPPPKSQVFKVEALSNGGSKITSTTVAANGKAHTNIRIELYDGKPHPVSQDIAKDAIIARRISARTIEGEDWAHGHIIAHFKRVVSKDGKTLTIEINGVDYPLKGEHHFRVFDKE